MLSDLATLIARGGSWRFLHGPVAAADRAHYPDPWDETRAGVARVIARTLWHAHAPFDATLEDVRTPGAQREALLRNTLLRLARVDDRGACFVLQHIGNDDVAGIAAHEVGRAFVGWLGRDGHPFRATPDEGLPGPAIGSLATVYLGLGVIAINAAYYSRAGGKGDGTHSHAIGRAGGLDVDDLAFLLAVQAEVRDDMLPALDSLRPTQTEAVATWRAVLEDHEDELRRLLGLNDGADDSPAPDRPPAPRPVTIAAAFDEAVVTKPNHGQRVFRIPETRMRGRNGLGVMICVAGGALAVLALPSIVLRVVIGFAAVVAGLAFGTSPFATHRLYRCATCASFFDATAAVCPGCGGTIAGDIAHRRDRLDAEERWEADRRLAAGHGPDEAAGDAGMAEPPR